MVVNEKKKHKTSRYFLFGIRHYLGLSLNQKLYEKQQLKRRFGIKATQIYNFSGFAQ
jgi:hypothetical protein